ncbi:hypothetical protein G6F37_009551 [Rhizopus arrhizus]|nr:hypothetical protein G6F38_009975 [Rhizopus arrhizus]KAG1154326.1 hypothetical protein G6F37_009551 [Rhizopus arrhizus]
MSQEVKQFCKSCDVCQRIKGGKVHHYNLDNTSSDFPFLRAALDFFGPLPVSLNQNKYVLVVIDCFTRYVVIYPVQSTTQDELVKVFFNRFVLRHGIPKEILTDGGPPFNSIFFTQLTKVLGSHNLLAPPYHPQSNGIVERFMATLRRMILTYTSQDALKSEWGNHLRLIQFVYNNTTHEATGNTPFYLVHGRHAKFPLTKTETVQQYNDRLLPEETYATELQQRHNLAFDVVDNNTKSVEHLSMKNIYQVDDKVLIFNQSLSSRSPRKLLFDWLGPFLVTSVKSKSTVDLKDVSSNKISNVHISRLKKYHQEQN